MPASFRGVIHAHFAEHDRVKREGTLTQEGYEAETPAEDAKEVKLLQTHVGQCCSKTGAVWPITRGPIDVGFLSW